MRYRQTSDNFRPPDYRISKYRERAAEIVEKIPVETDSPIVSFTIMAHPKRKEWAEELAHRLNCDITWDQKNDRHDTGLRAIKAYNPKATHHCVVQDDAVVPDNFTRAVKQACRYAHPNAPIGLYYGGKGKVSSAHAKAAIEAEKHNASWLVRKGPIWGPGIVYPVRTIPNLIEYFANSAVQNYDRRVMRYYQSINQDCWYTFPSLVDHRQEENPSLCGHDRGNRVAKQFIGPRNALEIDWSGPVLKANW
jgi:hypothetical protein